MVLSAWNLKMYKKTLKLQSIGWYIFENELGDEIKNTVSKCEKDLIYNDLGTWRSYIQILDRTLYTVITLDVRSKDFSPIILISRWFLPVVLLVDGFTVPEHKSKYRVRLWNMAWTGKVLRCRWGLWKACRWPTIVSIEI